MEVNFLKKPLRCMKPILSQVHSQEQTMEIRLPDAYPDIGKILCCWGQPLIRGKEWRNSGIAANGGVMAWVMYMPEDGTKPRVVDAWLPFQCHWDFSATSDNGMFTVQPLLSGLDGRSTSARKIMLRAVVENAAQAMESAVVDVPVPAELPEDVQLLSRHYPAQLPVEAGEKQVQIAESLSIPTDKQPLHKLIGYTLQPVINEQKVLSNRMVFHGQAELNVRYMTEDGVMDSWETEIPFSQYTELDRDYDAGASAWVMPMVTTLEMELSEDSQLHLNAGLSAQYVIYDETMLDLIEDAYSPNRDVKVQNADLQLPILLDSPELELTVTALQTQDMDQVLHTGVLTSAPYLQMGDDALAVHMDGRFQILYTDDQAHMTEDTIRFTGNVPFKSAEANRTDLWLGRGTKPEYRPDAEGMRIQCQYPISAQVYSIQPKTVVTGLEIGERKEPEPNRPAIILRRAGDEDLWTIAKKSGSTVEAIRSANHLNGEPEDGKMLLVPVI